MARRTRPADADHVYRVVTPAITYGPYSDEAAAKSLANRLGGRLPEGSVRVERASVEWEVVE